MTTSKLELRHLDENFKLPVEKGGRVNKNLLHNWYFGNPVNQRGQTEYTGNGYTIDRWKVFDTNSDTSVSLTENALEITAPTSNGHFSQILEINIPSGLPITLSVLSDGQLYSMSGVAGNTFEFDGLGSLGAKFYYSVTYNGVGFWYQAGASFSIEAIKLELGDSQTLAHQDVDGNWVLNEITDFGEQLAICQRYQIEIFDRTHTTGQGYLGGILTATSADYAYGLLPLPVTMRGGKKPSLITDCSAENLYNAVGTYSSGYSIGIEKIDELFIFSEMSNGVVIRVHAKDADFVTGNTYQVWVEAENEYQFLLDRNL